MKRIVVAIDGPAGSGKSTISRRLARELGYTYIDTGAMYRAMGLAVDRAGISPEDGPDIDRLCSETEVRLVPDGETGRVLLDGEDVTGLIRTPRASMMASKVSALRAVRDRLLGLQRDMGKDGGVVMDGRDIGTVVFPDAEAKIFLDADLAERAKRRQAELEAGDGAPEYSETLEDMKNRDMDDSGRDIAPLRQAEDAVRVDTTGLSIDEAVAAVKAAVIARVGASTA